ncbi:MAG: hypothetical protein ACO4CU_09175, partial [Ilumatobacteraceae bacterium]
MALLRVTDLRCPHLLVAEHKPLHTRHEVGRHTAFERLDKPCMALRGGQIDDLLEQVAHRAAHFASARRRGIGMAWVGAIGRFMVHGRADSAGRMAHASTCNMRADQDRA